MRQWRLLLLGLAIIIATQGCSSCGWLGNEATYDDPFDGPTDAPDGAVATPTEVPGSTYQPPPTLPSSSDAFSVFASVPVGDRPTGIARGANRIYVASSTDSAVTILDDRTYEVTDRVQVDCGPAWLDVNPDTYLLYVACENDPSVVVIDVRSAAVVTAIPLELQPAGLVVDFPHNRIFVGTSFGSDLTVIDGASNAIIGRIKVGLNPDSLRHVFVPQGPEQVHLVATDEATALDRIVVVDVETLAVVRQIDLGFGNTGDIDVDLSGRELYVLRPTDGLVTVIDIETGREVETIQVPAGATAMTTNRSGLVYVTDAPSSQLTAIDTDLGNSARLEIGAWAARLLYSANPRAIFLVASDGTLKVVAVPPRT